jgi:hypothetical protein
VHIRARADREHGLTKSTAIVDQMRHKINFESVASQRFQNLS